MRRLRISQNTTRPRRSPGNPPAPRELYTPERVERLDRLMGLVRQVSAGTDGMVRKRLDIQLSLWEKAKDVIATGELID